jgi:hypothetical protein
MLGERDAMLRRGDATWDALRARLEASIAAPLSENTAWTGKDVYGHLARWQQRSIDDLRTILANGRSSPDDGDENALNDRWAVEDSGLTADEARQRCLQTRTVLRAIVAGFDGTEWQRLGRLCDDITGPHYEHHLRDAGG